MAIVPIMLFSSQIAAAQDCGDYGGCEMVQLKVNGVVRDGVGTPITNATITGVTLQSDNVNAVEYYEHCGNRAHKTRTEDMSVSTSGSTNETGFYELLFIICADDKGDFGIDYEITIEAPGFQSQTIPDRLSDDDFDDEIDVTMVAQKGNTIVTPSSETISKGAVDCGDYTGCAMSVLKVRGYIRDESQNPITNAQVVAVETNRDGVNAIQFYNGCGDGFHEQSIEAMSTSDSNSFGADPGFYEVIFAVCRDDGKGLFPEWDADFSVTVTAPGFQMQSLPAEFDQDDDRDDRDFILVAGAGPTNTPTETPTMEAPTATPTETAVVGPPTALNPNADIDGSGRIDHADLLEVLKNWYHIVE